MACSLATTQANACTSGIGKLTDMVKLLQVIAELSCEIADAGGGGSGQIYTFTANPNTEGVVPASTSSPALAYQADGLGSTFVWVINSQVWA